MITFGCIGCGNMGSAILKGLATSEEMRFIGFNRTPQKLISLGADIPLTIAENALEVAQKADYIMIGVKPDQVEGVIREILPTLDSKKTLLSIAAGVTQATLKQACEGVCPVVRIMPNTPAMVGEGIFAICLEDDALDAARKTAIVNIFATIGQSVVLPESKFNAFTAVAGCGPAYVFHMMEAVVEAAVTLGFTRQDATDMVIKLFKGSVKLADESDTHLSLLREMVCSPAGVTIAAVNQLDRSAVRGNIIDAVLAARDRGLEMSK